MHTETLNPKPYMTTHTGSFWSEAFREAPTRASASGTAGGVPGLREGLPAQGGLSELGWAPLEVHWGS